MSEQSGQMKQNSTLTGGERARRSRQKNKCDASYSTYQRFIRAEYQPESLNSMLPALNRHLKREHDYEYSIIRDRKFYQSKLALEGKLNDLRQQ